MMIKKKTTADEEAYNAWHQSHFGAKECEDPNPYHCAFMSGLALGVKIGAEEALMDVSAMLALDKKSMDEFKHPHIGLNGRN